MIENLNIEMVPVVFSTDHNFIMPTYVAIASMLENSSRQCEIYLLVADDVTEEDKTMLQQLTISHEGRIEFISVGNIFDKTYSVRGITKATYFRLLIPWIIPNRDKVIYLDGDIVVTGDVAELYDYPIDEKMLISGVRTPGFSTNRKIKNEITKKGLDYKEYINAGILIFNSRKLREEDFKPIFMSHIDKQYIFQDQDILNITCRGRIGYLPLKFNFSGMIRQEVKEKYISIGLSTQSQIDEAIDSPVILHYAGAKPWREFTARWNEWISYYKKTPFYSQLLIDDISAKVLYPKFGLKKTIKSMLKKY